MGRGIRIRGGGGAARMMMIRERSCEEKALYICSIQHSVAGPIIPSFIIISFLHIVLVAISKLLYREKKGSSLNPITFEQTCESDVMNGSAQPVNPHCPKPHR